MHPVEQRRVDDVGVADDPADVRGRPEDVAGVGVVDVGHAPPQRDGVAAVVAHDALRAAGRARRVEDVERVGGGHGHAGSAGAAAATSSAQSRSRPAVMAASRLRAAAGSRTCSGGARPRSSARSSSGLYSMTRAPSMPHDADSTTTGRASSMRTASSCGGEAAEHHRVDGAEAGAGQHGDDRLGHHRHVDHDPVARGRRRARPARRRSARDLVAQLRVGEAAHRAGDRAVVDQRELVAAARRDVAVERVVARVEDAAGEPPVDGRRGAVEHLLGTAAPRDRLGRLAPEGVRLLEAAKVESCRSVTHRGASVSAAGSMQFAGNTPQVAEAAYADSGRVRVRAPI